MSRNKNRIADTRPEQSDMTAAPNLLNFVKPTEFVDLPSGGIGYPEGHPLHGEDTVEIYYMTAKDEDILTSQTLLKKGIAIDRFLDNIMVNKNIKTKDLLIGDKNAVLIAARISGYGSDYEGVVSCAECGTKNRLLFDLNDSTIKKVSIPEEFGVTINDNGTYSMKLPYSGFTAVIRMMTGADESFISKYVLNSNESESPSNLLTTQFKRIIVSIEGYTDAATLHPFIEEMPAADSRRIRFVNRMVASDIEIKKTLVCKNCSHEQEVDVPFGTNFLWPDR